jgi:ABC-2 type transport system permease protein
MNSNLIRKPFAFIKRDFLTATSYRLKFFLQIIGILVSTLMFFFLSRLIGKGVTNQLEPYGGDYFAFVLIGIALSDYLIVSLNSFSSQIRNAQIMGTLEALLVTPTSVITILISSSLYNFLFTSLRVILYLLIGVLLFSLKLHVISFFAFVIIMVLTIMAFTGIGLLSAAFIIIFKEGSPINLMMSTASGLLGGVLYPINVLPSWLKPFAYLLPITHALDAMRQVLLNGSTFVDVYDRVLTLTVFAGLFFSIGLLTFGYSLKIAKKEGSFVHY